MHRLSRKSRTQLSYYFLSNIILLSIISRVVIADEVTDAILNSSTYLYYFESDDALLDVGQTELYTFAPLPGENITIVAYGLDDSAIVSISLFDSNGNSSRNGCQQPSKHLIPQLIA